MFDRRLKERLARLGTENILKSDEAFFAFGLGVSNFLNLYWALVRGFFFMSVIAILQIVLIR